MANNNVNISLIPKQIDAYDALTDMNNGVTEVLYGGGARGGKALRLNELVCTPYGFREVQDLKVGDIITSATTGGTQRIIYLHPIQIHQFYRIEFNDGTFVDCSEGHLWKVRRTKKRTKRKNANGEPDDWRIWETGMMYEWMERKKEGINKDKSLMIPLCAPVQFTCTRAADKPIDPYTLGVILGDGCITDSVLSNNCIEIATPDQFIVDKVSEVYQTKYTPCEDRCSKCYIRDKELINSLRKLKLAGCYSHNKFIPRSYKYATLEERKALVRGLMDTDGYVDSRGHMSYTSVSKELAEDFAFIIRSLGGKATVTQGKAGYKKDGEYIECRDAYDVTFTTNMNSELVSLPKKLERVRSFYPRLCTGKDIVAITPIGMEVCRCITVDEPTGLFITKDFTVTHNSWLGCLWQILNRFTYAGSAGMICREDFTMLTKTTFRTFKEVLATLPQSWQNQVSFRSGVHNTAEFKNGSVIFFVHLEYQSRDPNFDRFGSFDLTDLFVDEAQQINEKAIDVLRGRFSKLSGTQVDGTPWRVKPKALYTCNPSRGWNYTLFVKPDKEGTLPPYRKFIKALVDDNPHISQDYIDNLMRSDKITVERLRYGNFEYDDDPSVLCDFDAICEVFDNPKVKGVGTRAVSADIATKGHDRFIVVTWVGNVAHIVVDKPFCEPKQIEEDLRRVLAHDRVPPHKCIVDSDGVGNYLASYIKGVKEFHGGGRAGNYQKYANLRSECYFKLAELINNRGIRINCTREQRERIKEELDVIRQAFIDNDVKRKTIIKKEDMKALLGHSPDYADALMMGMYFRRAATGTGAKIKVHTHSN